MIHHFLQKRKNQTGLWTILAVLVGIVSLFPLYWIFISSVKTDAEIFTRPPSLFPRHISWNAYIEQIVGTGSVLLSARNSLIISVCAMSISFLLAVPAAYGVSRFRIPGARIIIMIFLVTQMLPSSLLLTPMFLTFSRLKLLNTYIAPILAVTTITIPFTLLVLRPMFLACPKEIEEAARIDGCNRISAFLWVVMPIVKTGLVTVCCFGFVHGWADLIYSLTFNTRTELFPMTSIIYNLMNQYGTRWGRIMAFGCLLILPPTAIFVIAQKYVISGIVGGAVKG
ncbi:sugar ABC transporter permease [Spirochaetia bacterium]|nr:sugar ABC transporter permease [Spirochaetia bacterium]